MLICEPRRRPGQGDGWQVGAGVEDGGWGGEGRYEHCVWGGEERDGNCGGCGGEFGADGEGYCGGYQSG